MSNLVLKYIGGLAIGSALVGGYAGIRHVMRDQPTVLPSREEVAALPPVPEHVPAYEIAVEPVLAEQPVIEAPEAITGVPEVCVGYFRSMERLAECKEFPEAARASVRDALDATRSAFDSLKDLSGEAQEAMADGCKQAADAIRTSAESMGCQL